MKKKYLILKLETKESLVKDGWGTITKREFSATNEGYPVEYDTLEQAEENLPDEKYEQYTIIPIYTKG